MKNLLMNLVLLPLWYMLTLRPARVMCHFTKHRWVFPREQFDHFALVALTKGRCSRCGSGPPAPFRT